MAGACAFGASVLSLGLFGLGLPFLLSSIVAAVWAALLLYALGRWALARAARAQPDLPVDGRDAVLGQELRGALQPALLVSDRLLRHDDPAIRRAGEAVVRSIERATALIVENDGRSDSK